MTEEMFRLAMTTSTRLQRSVLDATTDAPRAIAEIAADAGQDRLTTRNTLGYLAVKRLVRMGADGTFRLRRTGESGGGVT